MGGRSPCVVLWLFSKSKLPSLGKCVGAAGRPVSIIKEFVKHIEGMVPSCVGHTLHRHEQPDGEGPPLLIRL